MLTQLALAACMLWPAMQDPAPSAADALEREWNAAMTLKQQQKWTEGAAAFEAFSKAHADAPRAQQALLEAGVCWIGLGKDQQKLHRNTPESSATFLNADKLFQQVSDATPAPAVAPRARYLAGQIALYLGDPQVAFAVFDKAVKELPQTEAYSSKCLERRAYARRQLVENQGAASDLQLYLQQNPQGDSTELVRRSLRFVQGLDRPAPAWKPEHWASSDPLPPEVYLGDVVVLCFLASWCDKCAHEREFEKDLAARFGPKGVHFVGVVQPWQEHDGKTRHTLESFTAFAARSTYGFPLLLDSGEGPGATAAAFGCEQLPDMAVIGRDGRVRWHDHPATLLDVTLEKLLDEGNEKPR
ncbi:MAG: tetratricopeptide repeat protein [Planctomycetes bacterium]|nr:tetratricopeptide repeat protein [Planctomycetota bacterium]